MKKAIIVILALALAVAVVVIAGCSSEDTEMPSETEDMQTMDDSEDVQTPAETEDSEMPEEDMGPAAYVDVTPAEAQQLIADNPDLIIIDVSPHYAEGHLPGAVSYYLGDGSLDRAIPTLDKNATYLVYCHVDSVAISGAQKLIDAGFRNVYRLQGNYSGWVDAGYPVER
jgi:rhodanese-related sulfurtransferase